MDNVFAMMVALAGIADGVITLVTLGRVRPSQGYRATVKWAKYSTAGEAIDKGMSTIYWGRVKRNALFSMVVLSVGWASVVAVALVVVIVTANKIVAIIKKGARDGR